MKMSENVDKGKENEALVMKHYQDKGFTVLNQNDAGFPDLLLFRGKELVKMVEVKGGNHKVHNHQQDYLRSLESLGFDIEIVRVIDGELVEGIR